MGRAGPISTRCRLPCCFTHSMKKSEYSNHWKDPRWQKFRLKVLEKDGFKCTQCDDDKSPLNAHHLYYISKRKPWEYPIASVLTFCESCHEDNHKHPAQSLDWEMSVGAFTRSEYAVDIGRDIAILASVVGAENVEEMADAICWSLCVKSTMWDGLLEEYRKCGWGKRSRNDNWRNE